MAEDQSRDVTLHLDECHICEDTVVGLEGSQDTLMTHLKRLASPERTSDQATDPVPPVYENNPEFDRAMVSAQQIVNSLAPASGSQLGLQQIGDYEIVGILARGGMGSVFEARHTRLEKRVAIKILPERKMSSPDAIARFSREMKIIGQMAHPSMVAATDAGAVDGVHYLVMELVDGVDLGKIGRRCGKLNVADACELVRQAAIGIQYAHDQGVIHRDVKPSNLMLDRDSVVKVLDLGLATLGGLNGTVDELTTVGQLMGTLDYMAPEQCGKLHEVDERSDVYGLAATLYKLLCSVAPYSSPDNDTPLKKLRAMATEAATPIAERLDSLPRELTDVVDRCLRTEPAKRFATATALAEALEPFTEGHQLPELLERAQALGARTGSLPADRSSELLDPIINRDNGRSLASGQRASQGSKVKAATSEAGSWIGSFFRALGALIALGAFGAAAWASVVLYVNTMSGQLIIESEFENIEVTLLKDEQPAKDLRIEHGNQATQLRAGKYRIVINGESDELVIDNEQFHLKRGGVVVAKITRKDSNTTGDTSSVASAQQLHELEIAQLQAERAVAEQSKKLSIMNGRLTASLANKGPENAEHVEHAEFAVASAKADLAIAKKQLAYATRSLDRLNDANGKPSGSSLPSNESAPTGVPTDLVSQVKNDSLRKWTYGGHDIFYWIDKATAENAPNKSTRIIGNIQKHFSVQDKVALIQQVIESKSNEVSPRSQCGLVRSLAPLCESDEASDAVFEYAIGVHEQQEDPILLFNALERKNPKRVEKNLVRLAQSGSMPNRKLAFDWAVRRAMRIPRHGTFYHDTKEKSVEKRFDQRLIQTTISQQIAQAQESGVSVVGGIGGSILGGPSVKRPAQKGNGEKLSREWADVLIDCLDDEDEQVRKDACDALARAFSDMPRVFRSFEKILANEKSDNLLTYCFATLLDTKPDDSLIADRTMRLAENENLPMKELVHGAFELAENGDNRLLDRINSALQGTEWGIKEAKKDDGSIEGVREASVRRSLIQALNSPKHKRFLSVLRTQFDILDEESLAFLHDAIDESVAKILGGRNFVSIFRGYDFQYWCNVLRESTSDAQTLNALKCINLSLHKLRDTDNRDLAMDVVAKMRGYSFEDVDIEDGDSVQSLAIKVFGKVRTKVRARRGVSYAWPMMEGLFQRINELQDRDAMFLVWVLREYEQHLTIEMEKFLLPFVSSESPSLQRRAAKCLIRRKASTQSLPAFERFLASPDANSLTKLAAIREDARENISPKSLGQLDFETPEEVSTLLSVIQGTVICLKVIAEKSELLDQSYRVVNIDLWTGKPIETDSVESKLSIFDATMIELDKYNSIGYDSSIFEDKQVKEWKLKAAKYIRSRLENATGPDKRRMERALKVIAQDNA